MFLSLEDFPSEQVYVLIKFDIKIRDDRWNDRSILNYKHFPTGERIFDNMFMFPGRVIRKHLRMLEWITTF